MHRNLALNVLCGSICSLFALPALADYQVNQNLFTLSMGDRVVSRANMPYINNAEYHLLATDRNTVVPTSTDPFGNWGREFVYQFQVNQPSRLTLQFTAEPTPYPSGEPAPDFDFVLLSGLNTSFEFPNEPPESQGKPIGEEGIEFANMDPKVVEFDVMDTANGAQVGNSFVDYISILDDPNGKYIFEVRSGPNLGETAEVIGIADGYVTLDRSDLGAVGEFYQITNVLRATVLDGILPGTYYLVAEIFDGFDQYPPPTFDYVRPPLGNGAFSLRINVSEPDIFDFETELGNVSTTGEPLFFDTFGSDFDTALALYGDFDGSTRSLVNLIATNDDIGGTTGSYLGFPDGLEAGGYYLVIGGKDTVFTENFTGGPTTHSGNFKLRHSRGLNLVTRQITGVTDSSEPSQTVRIVEFNVRFMPGDTLDTTVGEFMVDLGTVGEALEALNFHTLGSDTTDPLVMDDTELCIFDSNGMFIRTNDDTENQPPYPAFDFRSEVDFPYGLHPGVYYAVVTGWDKQFDHGFRSELLDPYIGGKITFT
ncbi:MAG: hypothetical protein HKO57_10465, partial [Akkermansiaceae bacterium]|nr:hypothetical protein [Akkermansiaceae bacterium]